MFPLAVSVLQAAYKLGGPTTDKKAWAGLHVQDAVPQRYRVPSTRSTQGSQTSPAHFPIFHIGGLADQVADNQAPPNWEGSHLPSPPRVSIFLPSLEGGGAERCVLTLAEGLAERGADVSLVLAKAMGPLLKRVSPKVRVVDLKMRNVWTGSPRLAAYLKATRPDALLSSLEYANVAVLFAKLISGVKVRTIVSSHAMLSYEARASSHVTGKLTPALVRRLYPLADSVVAVSKAVAEDLSRAGRLPISHISVIYNPIPIREIAVLSRERVESSWLTQDDAPLVVSVGSLWPHKDHATLIKAVALARRSRSMRLAILGNGPERPRLQRLASKLGIENSVFMPGFVENPYSWMSASSVFALSSRFEGLPTVLVEAMACGLSPVATNCPGGCGEVLEYGKYGILTPVGDAHSLAAAICRALDRPFDAVELRQRAEIFSIEGAVDKYLQQLSVL